VGGYLVVEEEAVGACLVQLGQAHRVVGEGCGGGGGGGGGGWGGGVGGGGGGGGVGLFGGGGGAGGGLFGTSEMCCSFFLYACVICMFVCAFVYFSSRSQAQRPVHFEIFFVYA